MSTKVNINHGHSHSCSHNHGHSHGSSADPAMDPLMGLGAYEFLGKLIFHLFMKFWGLCTATLLILLLLFYLYGFIITLLILCTAIIGFLYNIQDSLLYYPDNPPHSRLYVELPSILSLPFENIFVKVGSIVLNMYLIKQRPETFSTAPTVIYFHGNAGNIGHRLLNAHALHGFSGMNVLLVEYRGYGKSSGSPSESGLYKDAQAAFDYLLKRKDIDQNKIYIFGRSLGGAVAIQLASEPAYACHARGLIIENTFSSLPDIAKRLFDFSFIKRLPLWSFKNQYPSKERIKKIKLPTLFLSGLADGLIPPAMMQDLYQSSGSRMKRVALFEAGTHNETWHCPGYYEAVNRFVTEASSLEPQDSKDGLSYTVDVPFNDHGIYII